MRNYLNNTFLKSKQNVNMPIVRALLKYDSSNFTLCPPALHGVLYLSLCSRFGIIKIYPIMSESQRVLWIPKPFG